LSGLAYDAAADRLVAVSDRGAAFSLPMTTEGDVAAVGRLGLPAGMNALRDAEAIRRVPDGAWLVAFERGARLLRYPGDAAALARPPTSSRDLNRLGRLSYNGGIEAMAVLAGGRVLLIAETGTGDARQAWILDGEAATPRGYATDAGFDPTDAVALPDGRVLVLERRFNGLSVPLFSSRLAWIAKESLAATQGPLTVERRRSLADLLPSENWEGIEVVERPEGPELWLVSDDNFRWPQNTLLARIRIADLASAPAKE
ncbi:MAG: esterase-like activity of phytase family protein, partial [Alphaproteobacteria bacterium]